MTFELGQVQGQVQGQVLGQVQGLYILHTLVTAAEQGDEEQSSRLIRGDQSSRHTQPRTTATSPSGKSELRGKSGDKKLI